MGRILSLGNSVGEPPGRSEHGFPENQKEKLPGQEAHTAEPWAGGLSVARDGARSPGRAGSGQNEQARVGVFCLFALVL